VTLYHLPLHSSNGKLQAPNLSQGSSVSSHWYIKKTYKRGPGVCLLAGPLITWWKVWPLISMYPQWGFCWQTEGVEKLNGCENCILIFYNTDVKRNCWTLAILSTKTGVGEKWCHKPFQQNIFDGINYICLMEVDLTHTST